MQAIRPAISVVMALIMGGGNCCVGQIKNQPPKQQPGQSAEEKDKEFFRQREYAKRQALMQRAKQGDANAAFELGNSYAYPVYITTGLTADFKRGADWYLYASLRGNVPAAYMLGELYDYGHGVPKDHKQAYLMISWAANRGHEPAKNFMRTAAGTELLTEVGEPFNPAWKRTEPPPRIADSPGAEAAKIMLLGILGVAILGAVAGNGGSSSGSDYPQTGMYSERCKSDLMALFFRAESSSSIQKWGGQPLSCSN